MTPELNPLQQAASLVDAGQWQSAELLLRQLIARHPGLPAAHYLFGLVLVNTEFNRTTDTLFVVLNQNNEIVSVDFPQDPIQPRAVSAPLR